MTPPIPDWYRVRQGRSNVVLIAPHGGRRPAITPAIARERKVNDLYTAALTTELADTLDATALINLGCDRNTVDLNRIGQITRGAPWFFDLLIEQLDAVLAHHGEAQVLLIHGWNVVQPKCDLGIGGVEQATGLHALGDAALSVDERYWRTRVRTFRAAAAAADIATPVAERYPAAHRSNLLQAFTSRFTDSADARLRRLAAWANARRLNAMQLELGIPLRWPGPLRRALQTAAADAFGPQPAPAGDWVPPPSPPPQLLPPLGFHFHDPRAGITAFTSIASMGPLTGGRLLLFLGGQTIVLFTGEESGHQGRVGSLAFAADGKAYQIDFSGYATRLADAGLYLDLEAALAASTLVDVRLALRFEPLSQSTDYALCPGHFRGAICVDNRRIAIAAGGFCDPGLAMRGPGTHAASTHLAATFADGRAVNLRIAEGHPCLKGIVTTNANVNREPRGELLVTPDGDVYTPRRFQLQLTGHAPHLLAQPLARMPILRPLGNGAYARITFGPARFDWGGQIGWGVYEHARRLA